MPRRSLLTPAERASLLAFPTTGDYSWQQNKQVEQGNFRPLPPLTRP